MNIDEKIRKELENDSFDIDKIILDDESLFERLSLSFKGAMKGWVIAVYFSAVIVGSLFLWSTYQFYYASELHDQVFWGVCTIVALNMQGFIKQWLFMETNRNSIMREVKRVEVIVSRLMAKMDE